MRDIQLDFTRKKGNTEIILDRLKKNKNADISKTRVRNNIERNLEGARLHFKEGKIVPEATCISITDKDELKRYMEVIKAKGIYVLDVETSGVDIWNDIIVGLCLYVEGENPAYVPLNHTNINGKRLEGQLDEEEVRELVKPYITDKSIKCITHNGKFDSKILYGAWGYKIGKIYWDTMIAHHIMNENEPKGLKYLYGKYINKNDKGMDYKQLFGSNTPFNFVDLDMAEIYGANDGIKTWRLYKFQSNWLNPQHEREEYRLLYDVFMNIEMELLDIVIDMELRGAKLDVEYLEDLGERLQEDIDKAEQVLDELLLPLKEDILKDKDLERLTKGTGKINYKSPQQVATVLYDIMKLPSVDRKSPRGTGEGVLKALKEKVNHKALDTFIDSLLEYKEKNKLKSFTDKLPQEVEERTGAIHSDFNQVGTATGRFASRNPNLQQIPSRSEIGRKIRQGFIARNGYVLVGSDFSQIEPRTLASITYHKMGGRDMYDAYREGRDLYVMMASRIYNLPEDDCREFDSEGNYQADGDFRRSSVKSVLLGIMYERGAGAIGEQFGKTAKWGEEIVNLFLKSFPHVERLRKYYVHMAEQLGYVQTIKGRKRRLPDMRLRKTNPKYINAHRQVLNAVIQGSAGDILKMAMIRVGNDKRLKELDAHIILTIHDELILEVREENKEEAGKRLAELMKEVGYEELDIPMKCDVEIMKRWGE